MSTANLYDTDEQLVAALRNGDKQAFTDVYNRFYQRVLYFARRFVAEADAHDVTAESFIQVWKKRQDFDHLKSLGTFLFVTARNKCYDIVRHHEMRSSHEADLALLMEENANHEFHFEEVRLELLRLLRQEIDKLPVKMREVFLLSFEQGLKPAQIASQLGISVKTVSNQKLSAIKLLREALHHHPLEIILLTMLCMEHTGVA